jgi:hypothetical protein
MGASLGGALINDRSARRQGDRAAQLQREILAEQQRQFDLGMERQRPFHEAGVGAVNELANFRFRAPTAADVEQDPGYAFGLREGRDALEGSAAARGGLFSGDALRALNRYGNDYGTTKFNDAFERARSTYSTNANTLGNLVNAGTGAATQMQQAGANFANNTGNILSAGANAQGAADVTRGNIWGNVLNQGVSIGNRNNWWQKPSGGSGDGQLGGYGDTGQDYLQSIGSWADGGPVLAGHVRYADGGPAQLVEVEPGRYEPKVGTRSTRRSSGGGNMGKDNVLRALAAGSGASAPARQGMGALPANPVTNPGGVTRARLEQVEKYADGGPVMVAEGGRMVPKVGTRSARPGAGGTGGGMSRDQVLAALSAAQAASAPPARSGMGALPVNPVTNPGGLRRVQTEGYAMGGQVRDYDAGGMVRGPGGPRDDAIPARLSNGEHVMDAQSVTAFGNGSNVRGQQKLNALRKILKGM